VNKSCSCGKPATHKAFIAIYPLNSKKRVTRSSEAFGVCADCLASSPSGRQPALRTALARAFVQAYNKSLLAISQPPAIGGV
jgi:hypothetical protein